MKNRLYLVGSLLLTVAAVGVLWWSPWEPREPIYEGKPLTYWLSTDRRTPESLFGDSNAVPFLIEALKTDGWFGAAVYRKHVWPKLPASIQTHLPRPADNYQKIFVAGIALERMGPVAKPAIPALVRALTHGEPSVVRGVFPLLNQIDKGDKAVVAALTGLLKNKDPTVRETATSAFLLFDPGAAVNGGVAPVTLVRSAYDDHDVRSAVGDAVASGDSRIIAAWGAALHATNTDIREKAVFILAYMGSEAAVKEGVKMLKDKDADIRQTAVSLLGHVVTRDRNAVAALAEALNDTDPGVRSIATNALRLLDAEEAAKAGVKPWRPYGTQTP